MDLGNRLLAGGQTERPTKLLFPTLIVVCAAAAYLNSFSGTFLLDDTMWIVDNPSIRNVWPPWAPGGGTLRPVLFFTLAINYAVSGLNIWSYHLVNLLIHVLAALVLYGLIRRTLLSARLSDRFRSSADSVAVAVALIWVVHPLQTQSVTYIIQRGESLMGLFYLLSLYSLVRSAESPHSFRWFLVAAIAFFAGLGSKEVMITAPVAIFLFDWVVLTQSVRRTLRRRWQLYAMLASPLVLIAGWYLLGRPSQFLTPRSDPLAATPLQYALSQPGVILHYLRLCFAPYPLCLDYGWLPAAGWKEIVPPALIVGSLLLATMAALFRKLPVGFLGAWFFLILAPTSSVVPLRDIAFEHRMYLPLAAVIVFAVCLVNGVLRRIIRPARPRSSVAAALLGVVVIGFAYLTYERNKDYRSDFAMWSDIAARRPFNGRAHHNLGTLLSQRGNPTEAEAHFRRALELVPDYAEAHNNLGLILARRGEMAEAHAMFVEAVRLKPTLAEAQNNLGSARLSLGQVGSAKACFAEALRLKPDLADAHNNLAAILIKEGNATDAISHFREALRIKPDYAEAHNNLGMVLLLTGQPRQSVHHFRRVLELQPNHEAAQRRLKQALDQSAVLENTPD